MQRITTEEDGIFKDGVAGVTRGTRLNAAWLNAVQEEICYLLERCGLTPSASAQNTQLYSALREAIEGIFEDSLYVASSTVQGQRTQIDPDCVTIDGVKLKKTVSDGDPLLTINETLHLAKALSVATNLNVGGDMSVVGAATIASLIVQTALNIAGHLACGTFECRGLLTANGQAVFSNLQAEYAVLKNAVSVVDNVVTRDSGGDVVEVGNSYYSNNVKRCRLLVQGDGAASGFGVKGVYITAGRVAGRSLHVINKAQGVNDFVVVYDYTTGSNPIRLCVLAPGADKWFVPGESMWILDTYTVA